MKLLLLSSICSSLRSRHAYKIIVSQGLPLGAGGRENESVNLCGNTEDAENRHKSRR